jgi:GNAT superfamily N-acetyltransferase
MRVFSIEKLFYLLHLVRKELKGKRIDRILSNPLYILLLFFLIIRSLVLRLIPHLTKLYFIRKDFDNEPVEINKFNCDFKIFTQYEAELKEYALSRCLESNFYYDTYSEVISNRFNNGLCACTLLEAGKIVSIFFTTTQNSFVEQVNYIYTPKKKEIAITDIYTLKNYRNKGYYSLLLLQSITYYKNFGITTLVMWIMKHNRKTIHAQLKVGFTEIFQTVSLFSWFGLKKTFINTSIRPLTDL